MPSLFLSHSSEDKTFARNLANKLIEAGISVWIDEAEINIGDSLIEKLSNAIFHVDFVAAVLSSHSIKSNWVKKELHLAMTREIKGNQVIVLPLLIEKCDIPLFLRDKLYADFTDSHNFDSELLRLFRAMDILIKDANDIIIKKPINIIDINHVSGRDENKKSSIGKTNIGTIIHRKEDEYYILNNVKEMKNVSQRHYFTGLFFMGLGLIIFSVTRDKALTFFFVSGGVFIGFMGFFLRLGSIFLSQAYDRDKNLLIQAEEIGKGYMMPFSRRWREFYNVGKENKLYSRGFKYVTCSSVMLYLILCYLFIYAFFMIFKTKL